MNKNPFFSVVSDKGMTIRGYEIRTTEETDSLGHIFSDISCSEFLSSQNTRMQVCFRFLDTRSEWVTKWRKAKGEEYIALDLVFLFDVKLPFYDSTLADLPDGLQRLVIGLAARDVFYEVLNNSTKIMSTWGENSQDIIARLDIWFHKVGYTKIKMLFELFENGTNLSDCEGIIPWLTFDEIVFLYSQWYTSRADFSTSLDSSFYYKTLGHMPKNKKKYA